MVMARVMIWEDVIVTLGILLHLVVSSVYWVVKMLE
jgi:hypothetical protein